MKSFRSYFFLVVLLATYACEQKEPDIPTPRLTFSEKIESNFESVTLSCSISSNIFADKLSIEYSKDKGLSGAQRQTLERKNDSFYVTISGLEIQTTYYYRYIVENKASSFSDETIRQFKTLDYVAPIVSTGEVKNVSGTKASLEGTVDYSCGKDVTAQGFKVGKDKDQLEEIPIGAEAFSLELEGLEFETVYYYQAYATSEIGTGYGEIREFKTCNAVSFKDITIKDITASGALVSGGIEDNGGIEIDNQGFRFNADLITDYTFVSSTGETTLEGLKPATTYQVWYYAKTFEGEFESEKVEFTTSDGVITFGTTAASNITAESIYITSSISNDGGSAIRERGVVYGTNNLPTIEGTLTIIEGALGQLDGALTSLTNSTTYYIRPYAINDVGISYGPQVTVSTLSGIAELSVTTVSQILAQSATLSSTVISDNGAEIVSRGFCYGETKSPTISGSTIIISGSAGPMIGLLESLKPGTTYYVRAFATTKFGTAYGAEKDFTTGSGIISFQNLQLTDILPESACASATISDAGGATITELGFCYATTEQPTITDKTATTTSTDNTYSANITGISRSTKYFIRAYAKNAIGTYYSKQDEFTTPSGVASLGTLVSTDVENTSAEFSCEVLSDGSGTILERGFCHSTSPTPTINSSKSIVPGTIGSMQSSITNLEPDVTYYVRAYVTTKYEITYSNEVQITTKLGLPKMSDVIVSDIQPTSVTLSSGIASAGDGYILEKGFCYSTSPQPSKDDNIIWVNTDWTVIVNGLEQNTKYFVRSFATTQYGTSYSNEVSFLSTFFPVVFDSIEYVDKGISYISVNCPILDLGGNPIIEQGICYSVDMSPTVDDGVIIGSTNTLSIRSLTKNTNYYIRRFVKNKVNTFYSEEICIKTLNCPDDAIQSCFSINDSVKVSFAKANLQMLGKKSEGYNRYDVDFMDSQYSIYERESKDSYNFNHYPSEFFSATYAYSQAVQESPDYLSLGESWRFLSDNEWEYLLSKRINANNLIRHNMIVNSVPGILILPDNWNNNKYNLYNGQVINEALFNELEKDGAFFIAYSGRVYVVSYSGAPDPKLQDVLTKAYILTYNDDNLGYWGFVNNKSFIVFSNTGDYSFSGLLTSSDNHEYYVTIRLASNCI